MIRKLVLPALAALLLAGCASYQYRGGAGGDYYYGQPGTEYRYYGYPYGGYGYGSYGYGYPSYFSYRSYYGYPYGYGGYYRPPYHGPRPGNDHGHGDNAGGGNAGGGNPGHGQPPPASNENNDQPRAPWRDLERLRERARVRAHDRTRGSATEPQRSEPQRSEPIRRITPAVQSRPNPRRTVAPEMRMNRKRDSHRITEP